MLPPKPFTHVQGENLPVGYCNSSIRFIPSPFAMSLRLTTSLHHVWMLHDIAVAALEITRSKLLGGFS